MSLLQRLLRLLRGPQATPIAHEQQRRRLLTLQRMQDEWLTPGEWRQELHDHRYDR